MRSSSVRTLVLAVCGCNAVYGLEETRLPDAPVDADCARVMPDEDADCIANDADNCPGIANSAQLDRDADGVGDICDPRPTVSEDRLVTFQSFDDPASAQQQWRARADQGMWIFEPGEVVRNDITDPESALELIEPVSSDAFTITIGFRVIANPPETSFRHYEIVIDHPVGALLPGHLCVVAHDPNDPPVAQLLEVEPGVGNSAVIDDPPAGSTVVIQLTRDRDTELRCGLRVNDEPIPLGKVPHTVSWTNNGNVSFFIRNVAVSVLWTALYTQ